MPIGVGVATGGGGRRGGGRETCPSVGNSGEKSPQKSRFVKKIFGIFGKPFRFSNMSKIKCPKPDEKLKFGGRWF